MPADFSNDERAMAFALPPVALRRRFRDRRNPVLVLWHTRKANYNPDAEDWFWYTALPLCAYTALLAAAAMFWWWRPTVALFVIAATSLLFLFLGIHNAWDTVTYIALQRQQDPDSPATTNEG